MWQLTDKRASTWNARMEKKNYSWSWWMNGDWNHSTVDIYIYDYFLYSPLVNFFVSPRFVCDVLSCVHWFRGDWKQIMDLNLRCTYIRPLLDVRSLHTKCNIHVTPMAHTYSVLTVHSTYSYVRIWLIAKVKIYVFVFRPLRLAARSIASK